MDSDRIHSLVITDGPSSIAWTETGRQMLSERGDLATLSALGSCGALADAIEDVHILAFSPWTLPDFRISAGILESARRLRVIAGAFDNRFGDFVSMDDIEGRGIRLVDTSRSMTPTVAEFALAMTLNLLRDIPAAIESMRQGMWKHHTSDRLAFVNGDLEGKRVGLAGYGSINRRFHELIDQFGCEVTVFDPAMEPRTGGQLNLVQTNSLTHLAASSEILVVGIPPLQSSLGAVSQDVFDALPNGALFVLVSRMAVVDENALWSAIRQRRIRAAIDVFGLEPLPSNSPYRSEPNVLPTPHMAGDAFYCHERCFTSACVDALAVIDGQEPRFAARRSDALMYAGIDQMGVRT